MMNSLQILKTNVFQACGLEITNYREEEESKEYEACRFDIQHARIIFRSAKLTPKKTGMFVTFWKRSVIGPIEPIHEQDDFDFFLVEVKTETNLGLFIFPKTILAEKGIISNAKKEGKRAFRVYSPWDLVKNNQAEKSKKWQFEYFYEISKQMEFARIKDIFN